MLHIYGYPIIVKLLYMLPNWVIYPASHKNTPYPLNPSHKRWDHMFTSSTFNSIIIGIGSIYVDQKYGDVHVTYIIHKCFCGFHITHLINFVVGNLICISYTVVIVVFQSNCTVKPITWRYVLDLEGNIIFSIIACTKSLLLLALLYAPTY